MELTFDGTSWSINNVAQNFIDTNSFSSSDETFPYVPPEATTPDTETGVTDPCPPGYIYDESLKQCVPDPNTENTFLQEQNINQSSQPDQEGLYIPSNEIKEDWIANANNPKYEGGKTGLQNYIDNLDDRGWIKKEDNKIIFLKDNLGNAIASAAGARIGMAGEPKAKTDKIIQDLQRMGAIDAQVTSTGIDKELSELTGQDEISIDFAPEMEVSTTAFTFPTYNYEPGTELTGFKPGDYTGFTTPKGDNFKTWEDYINSISKVQTSVTKPVRTTLIEPKTGDASIAEDIYQKEKEEKEKIQKQEKEEFLTLQPGKSITDSSGDTYTKKDDGGYTFTPKETKPAVSQKTKTGVNYGTGRGGTAAQQQKMKGQSGTSLGSSVHGSGSYNKPKTTKKKYPTGPYLTNR